MTENIRTKENEYMLTGPPEGEGRVREQTRRQHVCVCVCVCVCVFLPHAAYDSDAQQSAMDLRIFLAT